jgi:catechol 2,3-dioxygenase
MDDIFTNEKAGLENTSSDKNQTRTSLLGKHIEMGPVELFVSELQEILEYYTQAVGLDELSKTETTVVLGYNKRAVLKLVHTPNLEPFPRSSAGLYHLAIVFESRGALARAVDRTMKFNPLLYQGTADHLVSEAFYFSDPEGNGLELYYDKDPTLWTWQNGKVIMDSLYIDPKEYIRKNCSETGTEAKKLGHIHLQIGNIPVARTFYIDILGFTLVSEFPGALFISDGYYHHNIGMNIWHSKGSEMREKTLGLSNFEVMLSEQKYLDQLKERLESRLATYTEVEKKLLVPDPWNNLLVLSKFSETS